MKRFNITKDNAIEYINDSNRSAYYGLIHSIIFTIGLTIGVWIGYNVMSYKIGSLDKEIKAKERIIYLLELRLQK